MRRALHSLIIALLCVTLSIDSAKACWFWRHRCRPAVARHAVCPPASTCGIPCAQAHGTDVPHGANGTAAWCQTLPVDVVVVSAGDSAVAADACDCKVECCTAEPAHAAVIVDEGPATETAVAAQATEPGNVVVHEPTVVVDAAPAGPTAAPTAAAPAAQDLLPVPQPAPTPPSVVTQASGARPAEPPVPASDDMPLEKPVDKPVEPLVMPTTPESATEPAAAAPEASLAVAPPPRPNLFDLYDDADDSVAAPAAQRDSEDAQVPPTAPPAPAAPEAEDAAPAPEPAMKKEPAAAETDKPAAEPEQPAAEPPQAEPEAPAAEDSAAEPAVEAAAQSVPDEPQRLWTDASGTHRARGWLVAVDVEHVRILKANGRHTTVAIAALSAADRDYVADVTARLAAARTAAPGPGETAGL